jgi:hypothetical protein
LCSFNGRALLNIIRLLKAVRIDAAQQIVLQAQILERCRDLSHTQKHTCTIIRMQRERPWHPFFEHIFPALDELRTVPPPQLRSITDAHGQLTLPQLASMRMPFSVSLLTWPSRHAGLLLLMSCIGQRVDADTLVRAAVCVAPTLDVVFFSSPACVVRVAAAAAEEEAAAAEDTAQAE